MEIPKFVTVRNGIVRDILAPEPMLLPDGVHIFDWDVLGLRQEEVRKESHEDAEAGKEKEEAKLEVAKHN